MIYIALFYLLLFDILISVYSYNLYVLYLLLNIDLGILDISLIAYKLAVIS